MKKNVKLNIPIIHYCNQKCIFCSEDTKGENEYLKYKDDKYIYSLIKQGFKNTDSLVFTTGEPTLNKNLELFVKYAKKIGYKRISLITNGIMMSDSVFRERILNSGLTEITFSIHGSNNIIHDFNTGVRGSFDKSFLALVNSLKENKKIDIFLSFVLNKSNINDLYCYIKKFYLLGVKRILINTIRPEGYGRDYFYKYGFSYDLFMKYFTLLGKDRIDFINFIIKKGMLNIMDIPFCVIKKSGLSILSCGKVEIRETIDKGKRVFIDNTLKNEIDEVYGKKYIKKCKNCIFKKECEGVYTDYINNFGTNGIGL